MRRDKCAAEKELRHLISKHRKKEGSLIPLLQDAQALLGYLPVWAVVAIARGLRLSPSRVYGVVTFYTQFRLQPVGRSIIKVCHGTACHVAGAERVSESLEFRLGVNAGGTTSDGAFTLENVACLGCCSLSPVVMVGETVYGKVDSSKIPRVLKKHMR